VGFKYLLQYKVFRLAEVDGESVLESGEPGLLLKPPPDMNADARLLNQDG